MKSIIYMMTYVISLFCSALLTGQHLEVGPISGEDIPAIRILDAQNMGIWMDDVGSFGVYIDSAQSGYRVNYALAQGFTVLRADNTGFSAALTGSNGFNVSEAGANGLRVGLSGENGVKIGTTGEDAIFIDNAGQNGVLVEDATTSGFRVDNAGQAGFYVNDANADGVRIVTAGNDGVRVTNAGDDGFQIVNAGGHGLNVNHASGSGIKVSNADIHSMDIQGDKQGPAYVRNHVVKLQNNSATSGGDVLALKVSDSDDPGDNTNFITFFKGGSDFSLTNAVGAVEGNGSGGVTFKTSGADFAEALSQIIPEEKIEAGDVVGVYGGKISLNTEGADQVMVITDRPAIIGNSPSYSKNTSTANASFVGQIFVKVKGPIHTGDWLIPSRENDGTAIALQLAEMMASDHIIGQAWETNLSEDLKSVNTLVGIGHTNIIRTLFGKVNGELQDQANTITSQQLEIQHLKTQLQEVINRIDSIHQLIKNK